MYRLKFAEVRPHPVKIQGLKTLIYRILKRSEVKSADVMRSHGFEYLKRKSEEYDARIWEKGNLKEVRQQILDHVVESRNGPEERKKMNEALKKVKPHYLHYLQRHERLLRP